MSRLRVMTYNVRYFGHSTRGVVSTRRGVERIAAAIAAMTPLVDVIALQEVECESLRSSLVTWRPRRSHRLTQMDALMRALNQALARRGTGERYKPSYFPAHTYRVAPRTNLYTTGLAILVRSRHRVDAHRHLEGIDITFRRGAKTLKQTRICAHVTVYPPEGGALDVFNTHMSLPGPFYREFWAGGDRFGHGPNQLAEAGRLVDAMNKRRGAHPMVLMGDFNSLPGSPVDSALQNRGGLVDALARTKGLAGTQLRSWFTAGFMKKRMNIDRIYGPRDMEWLNFDGSRPFDEHKLGAAAHTFGGLSDHVPIVGTLRLK